MPAKMDYSSTPASPIEANSLTKDCQFRLAMRKLWEDHITWTRVVIISAAASLPDTQFAVARLMQNQVDIGDAVKPYYGNEAGEALTILLKEHISGAYEVVGAAKAGDQAKVDAENKKWYANADEIAAFLSKANSRYWPEAQMKMHMKDHLDLTEKEAVMRLQKKWKEDITAYDSVHKQILDMADMLSAGIIKQFPDKF
jgi:hypothetical protein